MSENKNAKTPADGPVAWGCQCGKLYTVTCISSKPAKQWVGLTLKEILINRHLIDWTSEGSYLEFAREIERALKEKNHG